MGLFGDVWEAIGNTGRGIVTGAIASGIPGAIIGGIVGSQLGEGAANPQAGGLTPAQLVQAVMTGQGTGSLQQTHAAGVEQAKYQVQLEDGTRGVMTSLESAWTGGAADAARAKLQPLAESSASASTSLDRNSTLAQTGIEQFHAMKKSLHPEVANQPPAKSAWDAGTPWDTDTEDQINQYNQKAQENLERYNSYAEQSSTNTAGRTIDYGRLGTYGGGDFKVDDGGSGPGDGGKAKGFGGRSDPGGGEFRPPADYRPPPSVVQLPPPGQHTPSPQPYRQGDYGDGTRAAAYTPPAPSSYPGYQPPTFGPGTGGGNYGPGGGGFVPGFGPGGGFGPGSGSPGGPGTGSGLGAGRGSGAMAPGQPGQPGQLGRSGPSMGGPAGGQGRSGAPGMGPMGAGAGKGKGGGDDEEHQRASYLQEADPESVFGGSDTKPVPPVIGL